MYLFSLPVSLSLPPCLQAITVHGGILLLDYDDEQCTHLLAQNKTNPTYIKVFTFQKLLYILFKVVHFTNYGHVSLFLSFPPSLSSSLPLSLPQAFKDGKCVSSAHWLNDVLSQQKMFPPFDPLHFPLAYQKPPTWCDKMVITDTFIGHYAMLWKSSLNILSFISTIYWVLLFFDGSHYALNRILVSYYSSYFSNFQQNK